MGQVVALTTKPGYAVYTQPLLSNASFLLSYATLSYSTSMSELHYLSCSATPRPYLAMPRHTPTYATYERKPEEKNLVTLSL
jgi:hypothetical protein